MSDVENIIPLPGAEEIEAEAASWLTVLGRESLPEDDLASFKKWLARSERHKKAFDTLQAIWGDLAVLKELDDIAEATLEDVPDQTRGMRRRNFMVMAASVVGVGVIGGEVYLLKNRIGTPLQQNRVFVTEIGEQHVVELVDESTLQLNTNSRIEVSYSRHERSIILVQGEVFFDVAKDADRPFSVYVANSLITAIGTAFTVRLHTADDVEVIVEEGRVQLASLTTPVLSPEAIKPTEDQPLIAELTAGQNAIFNNKVERLAQLPQSDLIRKLSWRQGLLAYSGDPLYEVVEDISRYTDVHIEITDPELRELPVGGYFRVGEVEALFDSLELTFGLHVERVNETHVKLSTAS